MDNAVLGNAWAMGWKVWAEVGSVGAEAVTATSHVHQK
jgi:hypothetical protein